MAVEIEKENLERMADEVSGKVVDYLLAQVEALKLPPEKHAEMTVAVCANISGRTVSIAEDETTGSLTGWFTAIFQNVYSQMKALMAQEKQEKKNETESNDGI